jgi:hypothetical protein
MKVTVEDITPEIAKAMLEKNPANRRFRQPHAAALKSDMDAGDWHENGAPFIILKDGTLADGQHRAWAIWKSGITAKNCVVIRGMSKDAMHTIDTGAKRTVGDHLQIAGMANGNEVGAVITTLANIARHRVSATVTSSAARRILHAHPGILESTRATARSFRRIASYLGALHYLTVWSGHADRADALADVWKTGVPDYPGDPMHVLRERFIRTDGTATPVASDAKKRLLLAALPPFLNETPRKIIRPADIYGFPGWTREAAGLHTSEGTDND